MGNQQESEIIITRVFDVSRDLVWQSWTDPEQFKRWWGPKNFTAPVVKIDLRVGGKYLYCMRSAEGREFWSTGTYDKIIQHEQLVCTDSFTDEKGNIVPASHYGMTGDNWPMTTNITVTLIEMENKTKMILAHLGIPLQIKEMCTAGWNEEFDKLAESLTLLKENN